MLQIEHYSNHLPPAYRAEILALVESNAVSISKEHIDPDGPLLRITQARRVAEVSSYLDCIENPRLPPSQVVVSIDEYKRLVGFVLFMMAADGSPVCGINYAVVNKHFRRQGLLRRMIDTVRELAPGMGLTCHIGLVPVYKALGFKVMGIRGGSIAMGTQRQMSAPILAVEMDRVERSPLVVKAKSLTMQTLTEEMRNQQAQYEKEELRKAERFIQELNK